MWWRLTEFGGSLSSILRQALGLQANLAEAQDWEAVRGDKEGM